MRRSALSACVPFFLAFGVLPGIDSPAAEAPKGEIQKHSFDASAIFPGTTRDYWVYVPRQYDPSKPAALFVCQDGVRFKAPEIFDDLIAKGEIPALIGVFVMHGRVKAASDAALDRFNRSYEYDGLGDAYARFLIDELLPEVEKLKTADGRPVRLSRDPNDRAIAGASSGAVCAFTAAWERPDSFRRVFSAVGTYVGLRGANDYPTLVRQFEPKPLRVFLEDGSDDLNIYGGDWWMANQEMERALRFAGYEVAHSWGDGPHSSKHATEIFADAMRWLWKDHPKPIAAGQGSAQLREIVIPGEDWREIAEEAPAAPPGMIERHDGVRFAIAAGPGGRIEIGARDAEPVLVETEIAEPVALALSPDQSLLYVADAASRWVWSFQIGPDRKLLHGQRFYHLHVADDARDAGTTAMAVDRDGRLYVATSLGIQVCDQAGRVNAVLRTPPGRIVDLAFAGRNQSELCMATKDAGYRRRLKPRGADPLDAPFRPAAPKL